MFDSMERSVDIDSVKNKILDLIMQVLDSLRENSNTVPESHGSPLFQSNDLSRSVGLSGVKKVSIL